MDGVVARRKVDVAVVKPRVSHLAEQICSKTLDLSKVVRLLEDPLTTNMQERHMFVLKKVLGRRQRGFLLRELASISRILDACADKAKDHPEYAIILCEALQICRLPFLKERVSDELIYAQDVKQFLSHMGYLMRVPDGEVRHQVVESVKSFYICCMAPSKHSHHGPQPTSPGYRLQLLERSDLAQTLFLSMAALEEQPAIKLLLLQTLQILSSSSDMNCALMLSARGAETICLHMNQHDPSGRILFHSTEILWNLLERGSTAEVAAQLSSMECAISLKEAFFDLLLNGFRHADIQLRNDLLVLTTLFAETSSSLLVESFFAKQLIAISTFPELKSSNPLVGKLKLSCSMEDLQMKKLLLNLLLLMAKDSAAIQIFKEEQVMLALLTLIKPPSSAAGPSEVLPRSHHWASIQQEELQLHALAVLATVAPLMLDQYMSCYGNVALLHLLDWCTSQDAFLGHGHSFHATGGRGSKKAHMRYCIRLMRSVTSLAEKTLNQDLCDQGTIHLLLGLLMQMEASPAEEDAVTVEMKTDMQLIISALCQGDMHRKELFGCEGVEMAVHFLRRGSAMFYSGLGHNKLLLSTLVCVRFCIVGCYTTEDYFLSHEGAKVLLDLLSSSPKCVHGVILATLLELFDNPNTVPHILSWRHGHGGRTAPSLLLHVWRQEEAELGVSRNQHGGIEDPQRSILGHRQLEDAELTSTPNVPSAAVLEIQENLLAKIYLIFCKMGFNDLPGLSVKDQVTLCIVKRYLDFKVGEVWDEIGRELSLEGVRPVTPDQETLRVARLVAQRTAEAVTAEQQDGLRREAETASREEELAYEEMKSHWKQRQLTSKSWSDFVRRTSDYDTLKEIKDQRHEHAETIRNHNRDVAPRPEELFISQVMLSEDSDAPNPASIRMAKIPVMAAAHEEALLSERDCLRCCNTVPVKD